MTQEISIRQWQENYRSGSYSDKSLTTQVSAGWDDWYCSDEELPDRLKELAQNGAGIGGSRSYHPRLRTQNGITPKEVIYPQNLMLQQTCGLGWIILLKCCFLISAA